MFYEYNRIDSPDYFVMEEGVNFSYPEHMHVCFELITILSGEMSVTVDKNCFNLTKGDALLIFPHQLHSLKSDNSKHLLCIFSPNLIKAFHNKLINQIPTNNKFQPDQYLINSLLRLNNIDKHDDEHTLRVKRKGILYSLCAQFHEASHSGFTSSWITSDDVKNENRLLKITFFDPATYNSTPSALCIFGDDGTVDITEHIDSAYFHMWIKSSKENHIIEISLSNFDGDQSFKTNVTINQSDVWQQIHIPLKNMHHSKKFGKITRLILSNASSENPIKKDDYISISGIKVLTEHQNIDNARTKTLWRITTKTPEQMPKYRTQKSDTNRLLYQIFAFVEKNFSNDCSLKSLEKSTGYDYAYLSRFFKNSTNISFNSYVNNFRLNHACYLLNNSSSSIIECALNSGYKSIRTFNRNFKEEFGITPEEFRLKNKKISSTN